MSSRCQKCPMSRLLSFPLALLLAMGPLACLLWAQQAKQPTVRPEARQSHLPDEVDQKQTFMPVLMDRSFDEMFQDDVQKKPQVMEQQKKLLEQRYDLSDNPSDVWMSAQRRKVQQGVRARLPEGVSWQKLAGMSPDQIKQQGLWPEAFRPLPHTLHPSGGMVFPETQIKEIAKAEHRDLERFDVEFDLPEHLLPEFPPPMFLINRPDLGDVTEGQLLTIKNFQDLMLGKLTPAQLEGLRMLLTPFPQQQFNATHDRKVKEPSFGVSCLDCHANGHTNAAFHLNPDTRPQQLRFRIETPSLRGMFNQRIHGSKRALRSVEDFTEFEQRTAYFDGDPITATKKGLNVIERGGVVSLMGQMQTMFDFPPAPKLDRFGRLDPAKATELEIKGQEVFFGKARCADCHPAPHYLDNLMHDLREGEFYEPRMVAGHFDHPVGLMKTTTLRGIKDSPPYLHDGRLLTLEDTVEFFNLVLQLKLGDDEKQALVAFMRCL